MDLTDLMDLKNNLNAKKDSLLKLFNLENN